MSYFLDDADEIDTQGGDDRTTTTGTANNSALSNYSDDPFDPHASFRFQGSKKNATANAGGRNSSNIKHKPTAAAIAAASKIRELHHTAVRKIQQVVNRKEQGKCLILSASTLSRTVIRLQLQSLRWRVLETGNLIDASSTLYTHQPASLREDEEEPDVRLAVRGLQHTVGTEEDKRKKNEEANKNLAIVRSFKTSRNKGGKRKKSTLSGEDDDDEEDNEQDEGEDEDDRKTPKLMKLPPDGAVQLVLVDSFSHEHPAKIIEHLRSFSYHVFCVYLSKPRPQEGKGWRMQPVQPDMPVPDLYKLGYDLVIDRVFDQSVAEHITELFITAAARWNASSVRTSMAASNHLRIRTLLSDVTDRYFEPLTEEAIRNEIHREILADKQKEEDEREKEKEKQRQELREKRKNKKTFFHSGGGGVGEKDHGQEELGSSTTSDDDYGGPSALSHKEKQIMAQGEMERCAKKKQLLSERDEKNEEGGNRVKQQSGGGDGGNVGAQSYSPIADPDLIDTHPKFVILQARYLHSVKEIQRLTQELSKRTGELTVMTSERDELQGEKKALSSEVDSLRVSLQSMTSKDTNAERVEMLQKRSVDAKRIKNLEAIKKGQQEKIEGMQELSDQQATILSDLQEKMKRLQLELKQSERKLKEEKANTEAAAKKMKAMKSFRDVARASSFKSPSRSGLGGSSSPGGSISAEEEEHTVLGLQKKIDDGAKQLKSVQRHLTSLKKAHSEQASILEGSQTDRMFLEDTPALQYLAIFHAQRAEAAVQLEAGRQGGGGGVSSSGTGGSNATSTTTAGPSTNTVIEAFLKRSANSSASLLSSPRGGPKSGGGGEPVSTPVRTPLRSFVKKVIISNEKAKKKEKKASPLTEGDDDNGVNPLQTSPEIRKGLEFENNQSDGATDDDGGKATVGFDAKSLNPIFARQESLRCKNNTTASSSSAPTIDSVASIPVTTTSPPPSPRSNSNAAAAAAAAGSSTQPSLLLANKNNSSSSSSKLTATTTTTTSAAAGTTTTTKKKSVVVVAPTRKNQQSDKNNTSFSGEPNNNNINSSGLLGGVVEDAPMMESINLPSLPSIEEDGGGGGGGSSKTLKKGKGEELLLHGDDDENSGGSGTEESNRKKKWRDKIITVARKSPSFNRSAEDDSMVSASTGAAKFLDVGATTKHHQKGGIITAPSPRTPATTPNVSNSSKSSTTNLNKKVTGKLLNASSSIHHTKSPGPGSSHHGSSHHEASFSSPTGGASSGSISSSTSVSFDLFHHFSHLTEEIEKVLQELQRQANSHIREEETNMSSLQSQVVEALMAHAQLHDPKRLKKLERETVRLTREMEDLEMEFVSMQHNSGGGGSGNNDSPGEPSSSSPSSSSPEAKRHQLAIRYSTLYSQRKGLQEEKDKLEKVLSFDGDNHKTTLLTELHENEKRMNEFGALLLQNSDLAAFAELHHKIKALKLQLAKYVSVPRKELLSWGGAAATSRRARGAGAVGNLHGDDEEEEEDDLMLDLGASKGGGGGADDEDFLNMTRKEKSGGSQTKKGNKKQEQQQQQSSGATKKADEEQKGVEELQVENDADEVFACVPVPIVIRGGGHKTQNGDDGGSNDNDNDDSSDEDESDQASATKTTRMQLVHVPKDTCTSVLLDLYQGIHSRLSDNAHHHGGTASGRPAGSPSGSPVTPSLHLHHHHHSNNASNHSPHHHSSPLTPSSPIITSFAELTSIPVQYRQLHHFTEALAQFLTENKKRLYKQILDLQKNLMGYMESEVHKLETVRADIISRGTDIRRFNEAIDFSFLSKYLGPEGYYSLTPATIYDMYCTHHNNLIRLLRQVRERVPLNNLQIVDVLSSSSGLEKSLKEGGGGGEGSPATIASPSTAGTEGKKPFKGANKAGAASDHSNIPFAMAADTALICRLAEYYEDETEAQARLGKRKMQKHVADVMRSGSKKEIGVQTTAMAMPPPVVPVHSNAVQPAAVTANTTSALSSSSSPIAGAEEPNLATGGTNKTIVVPTSATTPAPVQPRKPLSRHVSIPASLFHKDNDDDAGNLPAGGGGGGTDVPPPHVVTIIASSPPLHSKYQTHQQQQQQQGGYHHQVPLPGRIVISPRPPMLQSPAGLSGASATTGGGATPVLMSAIAGGVTAGRDSPVRRLSPLRSGGGTESATATAAASNNTSTNPSGNNNGRISVILFGGRETFSRGSKVPEDEYHHSQSSSATPATGKHHHQQQYKQQRPATQGSMGISGPVIGPRRQHLQQPQQTTGNTSKQQGGGGRVGGSGASAATPTQSGGGGGGGGEVVIMTSGGVPIARRKSTASDGGGGGSVLSPRQQEKISGIVQQVIRSNNGNRQQ